MTITIELPDETVAALILQARTEGRFAADLAAEAVSRQFSTVTEQEEFPLNSDALESLRRGFADLDAGQTLSLEEARTGFAAAFTGRFGETDT